MTQAHLMKKTSLISRLPFFGLTPKRIAMFIVLSMGAAFFEGFGMAMFLPVLEFIEKGRDVAGLAESGGMWEKIIQAFEFVGLEVSLAALLAAAIGAMLIRVVAIYARQVYNAWLGQEVLHTTRSRLFDAYMRMDYGAYSNLSSGGIINVLTTEAQRAGGSFNSLFAMISNLAVVAGFAVVLLWLSAPLTLLAVGFLAAAGAVVAFYVRHTRKYSHMATGANDQYSRMVMERLGGYRLVKLTAAGDRESDRVREASGNIRNLMYRLAKIIASVDLIMEPMVLLAGGGILFFAVTSFGMSLSEVGIFVLILIRILPLAKEVMKSRQAFVSASGSLHAVLSGYDRTVAARESGGGDKRFAGVREGIDLDEVTFAYDGAGKPALNSVTLHIPAGKATAVVGPSGAGKTTLADVIARLRVPSRGQVLYDGVDGARFDLASLRRGMAFVSQDAAVLDDTVAENLRFAKPGATEEEILDALQRAQAGEFVRSLPDGLDTRLGERGTKLSGGQKQRLSLARALLQDTGVLILDEPTSALDSETERDIQRAIDDLRLHGETTVVIIAHRLSTIRHSDKIVVMEDGRVVEQGTHQELMVSDDWYARVSGMQSSGDKH